MPRYYVILRKILSRLRKPNDIIRFINIAIKGSYVRRGKRKEPLGEIHGYSKK
jgi:hypothetical protein